MDAQSTKGRLWCVCYISISLKSLFADNKTVSEAWSNLLSAIHTLLVTKRKQIGAARAGAFVKRLCMMALAIDRSDIVVAIMWLVHAVLVVSLTLKE